MFTQQELELIKTLVAPIAQDDDYDNFTRKVAVNIITKIDNE